MPQFQIENNLPPVIFLTFFLKDKNTLGAFERKEDRFLSHFPPFPSFLPLVSTQLSPASIGALESTDNYCETLSSFLPSLFHHPFSIFVLLHSPHFLHTSNPSTGITTQFRVMTHEIFSRNHSLAEIR